MQKPTSDESTLRDTVNDIDGYAQAGFGQISAVAKLALLSMELPDSHRNLEGIAQALQVIWGLALDMQNTINCAAEKVGCNYVDKPQRKRAEAARLHHKSPGV